MPRTERETVWVEVAPGRSRLVFKDTLERSGQDAFYFKGSDLSKDEARRLTRMIGVPISNMVEAKAAMAERGLRFVEKGDAAEKARRGLREWVGSGPSRGALPEELDPERYRPGRDIKEIYREVRERRNR